MMAVGAACTRQTIAGAALSCPATPFRHLSGANLALSSRGDALQSGNPDVVSEVPVAPSRDRGCGLQRVPVFLDGFGLTAYKAAIHFDAVEGGSEVPMRLRIVVSAKPRSFKVMTCPAVAN